MARHTPTPSGDPGLEQLVSAWTETNQRLERIHSELVSSRGARRRGAEARQVTNNQSLRLSSSPGALAGYSLHETTGAAGAVVRLRDGFDATGDVLAVVVLAAGAAESRWMLPAGVGFTAGLFLEIASGQVEGAVYFAPAAL